MTTYYIQVLSLGLVWTFVHCSGMCGPLVAGLTARSTDRGSAAARLFARARRVLAYQSGRAVTYAAMGATAGLVGAAFEQIVRDVSALSGFVIAPLFLGLGVFKLAGRQAPGIGGGAKVASLSMSALRRLRRAKLLRGDVASSVATGLVMGLLPCMLMFWVLGVAATTASPVHGAGVMVTLVLLTTPTLLAAGCAASIWKLTWSERLVGAALVFSAVWMLLVALAANDVIGHAQMSFQLFGDPFMLMLF